jgi:hypothetical protein
MGNKWLTRIRIFQDQQLPKLTKLGFVSFGGDGSWTFNICVTVYSPWRLILGSFPLLGWPAASKSRYHLQLCYPARVGEQLESIAAMVRLG